MSQKKLKNVTEKMKKYANFESKKFEKLISLINPR